TAPASCVCPSVCYHRSCCHRSFLPFPTRRSSDLLHEPAHRIGIGQDPDPTGHVFHRHEESGKEQKEEQEKPDDEQGLLLGAGQRSEQHTSELQSREKLVCRLLLEKKNNTRTWPAA